MKHATATARIAKNCPRDNPTAVQRPWVGNGPTSGVRIIAEAIVRDPCRRSASHAREAVTRSSHAWERHAREFRNDEIPALVWRLRHRARVSRSDIEARLAAHRQAIRELEAELRASAPIAWPPPG